jgi:predicted metal-dependent peptidase
VTQTHMRSADADLRSYVEEMLHVDRRFLGMSRYVFDINFYWVTSIKTACAGHGFIFFNPDFWDKLNEEKKKTIIAHEIWHLILNHLARGQGFDPDSYNIAGDHVINIALMEDGFVMGQHEDFGGITPCCDPKYRGMSTEQVYAKVHADRKKDPNSHKPAEGTPSADQIEDLVKDALEGTGKDLSRQIEENKAKADAAMQSGKTPGNQQGGTSRLLQAEGKKIHIKKASYEEIFEDYLTDPLSGGKRTFMRPSRRQVQGGLRMKGKFPKRGKKNRLTHLVYALDVSGSISHHMAQQFLRSAKTLKETLNPVMMTVILWDTRIVFEKTYREDETLDGISVRAGGGTNLEPVYRRVREINPEALVIFTDLCVQIPPEPEWDTIWFLPETRFNTSHVTYGEVYLVPEK